MAEVKNSFIKSKMNKDLDARLIPNGEYREGVNIQVSKSEGADVGALENVLGNDIIMDLSSPGGIYVPGLTTIGMYSDDTSNNIYVFLTDFTETNLSTISGDSQREYNAASLNYYEGAQNFIWVYNTRSREATLLVKGAFLNFSTTNSILSVNLLEDLLFWTDNRNQPRRINVSFANTDVSNQNPTYYINEDQISVASYNPFEAINLYYINQDTYNNNGGQGTTSSVSTGTTPDWTVNLNAGSLVGVNPSNLVGAAVTWTGQVTGVYTVVSYAGNVLVITGTPNPNLTSGIVLTFNENLSSNVYVTSMLDVTSPKLPNGIDTNPDYNASYPGDPDYLEDKFVRFSYRFKFEDGEVSIMSPFTQAAFIPKQDGYFLTPDAVGIPATVGNTTDENSTFRSTVVDFMENKVNQILLQIPLPVQGQSLRADYKVDEIEIIYKESDALATKVVDTIPWDGNQGFGRMPDPNNAGQFIDRTTTFVDYNYQGVKPYKTLPKGDLTRVYDKVPVRALGQEIISNRIVYSNFQDKHTPPETLEFNVGIFDKKVFDIGSAGAARNKSIWYTSITEYPMHTVKQNRNYQVGVVLSDRYGRSSTTILSSTQTQGATLDLAGDVATYQGGTTYHPYTPAPPGNSPTDVNSWPGDSIKVLFNQAIGFNGPIAGVSPNLENYWPGLYNGDSTSAEYNPLGWYSYKIVVKQNEQEYYNVYLPGILNGYPGAPAEPADPADTINFITLFGDNINKIPADLTEVGPDQKQYRSGIQLYGRVTPRSKTVAPIVESPAFNTQFYPGNASDTTIALANQNSMLGGSLTEYLDVYQTDSNPPLGRVTQSDVTNPIGSNPQPVATTTAYNFLLGVYETEPVESVIDIFWETSTSGLISDLNEAINAESGGIVGVTTGSGGTTWVFNLYEDILPSNSGSLISSVNSTYSNGQYTSVSFYPYYSTGVGDNPQDTLISIDSVIDNTGNNRTSEFFIERTVGSPDSYLIYPNAYFYYNSTASVNETYTFTLTITDGTQGPNYNKTTTITAFGSLQNVAPNISNCEASMDPTQGIELLKTYVTTNGSSDPSRNKQDITYSLTQNPPIPELEITTNATTGDGDLKDPTQSLNGAMTVTVTATDAGGATTTCITGINGSVGYRTQPINNDFYTSGPKSINGNPFVINKATESSGFFWTTNKDTNINGGAVPGSQGGFSQAMNRTPVLGLTLSNALNSTIIGQATPGTDSLSQDSTFQGIDGVTWEWTNTNRTAAASVANDFSITNSSLEDSLGSNAYNGELKFGPPIGLTEGTAYIIVDFEASILPDINITDAPGYIWPVYLQYRVDENQDWGDVTDIEGKTIVFGQTQVNDWEISNLGQSPFAETGVINDRDKSEFTVPANTYDPLNAAESYNYGRGGNLVPQVPIKSVCRRLFAFGMCQAYRDQTTFDPVPTAPDKFGDYRLQVRYPSGRNQVDDGTGTFVDGGKAVTIGSNFSNPVDPYTLYAGAQISAQVKLQFGDFYNPFQLGYAQNQISFPYRVSRGFSTVIPNAEILTTPSDNVVYAREWAFKYVSQFYLDAALSTPWRPGEEFLPGHTSHGGGTNPAYNGQVGDAYYLFSSASASAGASTANSDDGNDYSNVEKDKFTEFAIIDWTNIDRKWVAEFSSLGKKIKGTALPLQRAGDAAPAQPDGALEMIQNFVPGINIQVRGNGGVGNIIPYPYVSFVFTGTDAFQIGEAQTSARAFASGLTNGNFNENSPNTLPTNPNREIKIFEYNYVPAVGIVFNGLPTQNPPNQASILTFEYTGTGANINITNCVLSNQIDGTGTHRYWWSPIA